jgi:hypothetical protein
LFLGRIDDEQAFPFPRLADDERKQVDGLIGELRSYCADHDDPRRVEAERWVPDQVLRDLGERGLLGLYVPERYGGQGLSQTGYCTVFDAVGQIDSTLAVVLGVHQSIGYKGIHLFGTDEQKEQLLPDLARGRRLAAYALTEPDAGEDAYHLATRARRQPDPGWPRTSTAWRPWATWRPAWSTGAWPTTASSRRCSRSRASSALARDPAAGTDTDGTGTDTAHAAAAAGTDVRESDEAFTARTFCGRAEHRARRWLHQLDENDDESTLRIAETVIARGSYPYEL